jgi:hypothetical protein
MIRHQARERLRVAWRAGGRPVCFLSFIIETTTPENPSAFFILHPTFTRPVSCVRASRFRPVLVLVLSCPALVRLRFPAHPATHLRTAFTRPVRPAHDSRSLPVRCSAGYGSLLTNDDLPATEIHQSCLRHSRVSCSPGPCPHPLLSSARGASSPLHTTEFSTFFSPLRLLQ